MCMGDWVSNTVAEILLHRLPLNTLSTRLSDRSSEGPPYGITTRGVCAPTAVCRQSATERHRQLQPPSVQDTACVFVLLRESRHQTVCCCATSRLLHRLQRVLTRTVGPKTLTEIKEKIISFQLISNEMYFLPTAVVFRR